MACCFCASGTLSSWACCAPRTLLLCGAGWVTSSCKFFTGGFALEHWCTTWFSSVALLLPGTAHVVQKLYSNKGSGTIWVVTWLALLAVFAVLVIVCCLGAALVFELSHCHPKCLHALHTYHACRVALVQYAAASTVYCKVLSWLVLCVRRANACCHTRPAFRRVQQIGLHNEAQPCSRV